MMTLVLPGGSCSPELPLACLRHLGGAPTIEPRRAKAGGGQGPAELGERLAWPAWRSRLTSGQCKWFECLVTPQSQRYTLNFPVLRNLHFPD